MAETRRATALAFMLWLLAGEGVCLTPPGPKIGGRGWEGEFAVVVVVDRLPLLPFKFGGIGDGGCLRSMLGDLLWN